MNRISSCLIILTLITAANITISQPHPRGLLYMSMRETNEGGESVWFNAGVYDGNVHSNGVFNFANHPVEISGRISSSQDSFQFGDDFDPENLNLSFDPIFSLPEIHWNNSLAGLEDVAIRNRTYFQSQNGRLITYIELQGINGVFVYQFDPLDEPVDTAFVAQIHNNYYFNRIVFVDGVVEISGELQGNLIVASTGDIWLVDNVLYRGANPNDGSIERVGWETSLELISAGNIIIKDTPANGRGNGFQAAPDDRNRHSIAINGGLVALGGSLKFEHTNADEDEYQGPEPDERGLIYLTGYLYQRHAFPLNNDNHGGTGYHRVVMREDERFSGGVAFVPIYHLDLYIHAQTHWIDSSIEGNPLVVVGDANVWNAQLIRGCELIYLGAHVISCTRLQLLGSPELPVRITRRNWEPRGAMARLDMFSGWGGIAVFNNVVVGEGVELHIEADSIHVDNLSSTAPIDVEASLVHVEGSRFTDQVYIRGYREVYVGRNIFERGVILDGITEDYRFANNTITNPVGSGVVVINNRRLDIRNNIVAFCRSGIVNQNGGEIILEYNDVFGNEDGDYEDCQPGEGSISADPRFTDFQRGDYSLTWDSPCIDAGDPNSPPDPDGSRADMGSIPFHHELRISIESTLPKEFTVIASPNPFNSRVSIQVWGAGVDNVELKIYNIIGRELHSTAGAGRFALDGMTLGAPGVYFGRVKAGGQERILKLLYLP